MPMAHLPSNIPLKTVPSHNLTAAQAPGIGGWSTHQITANTTLQINQPPPNNAIHLGVNGMTFEGPTFYTSGEFYVTDIRLDHETIMHFHVLVWRELFGSEITDYGVLLLSGKGVFLTFGSRKSRTQFLRWLERYRKTFFRDIDLAFTRIPEPEQGRIDGYYVPDPPVAPYASNGAFTVSGGRMGEVNTTNLEDWVRIVYGSKKPVYRVGRGWLFTSATDGVVFKMGRE